MEVHTLTHRNEIRCYQKVKINCFQIRRCQRAKIHRFQIRRYPVKLATCLSLRENQL